jgi:hypothetical protein
MSGPTHWTRHPALGGLIGVFAGALVIALVEFSAHRVVGTADVRQPGTITTPMFASVLVAWLAGAATAGLVATRWSGARSRWPGLLAAGVLLAGSVATMLAIPHPGWVMTAAVLGMPAAAWLTTRPATNASA